MPGLYLIETKDGAGLSSLPFTTGIDGTFDEHLFVFSNLLPGTNAVTLQMRNQPGQRRSASKSGAAKLYLGAKRPEECRHQHAIGERR